MKKYLPYLNILGAAACWGCIGLFNRFLMRAGMGAANIVVIRNFGGLVLLTLIFALRERSVFHVKAKHLPIFFGTGVVSMVFFTLCYFKCQELCSLAVSAILLYTAPAMVVLMSAAVFRERITRKKILALALALLGCSFVTGVWSGDASVTAAGVVRTGRGLPLRALLHLRAVRPAALYAVHRGVLDVRVRRARLALPARRG